MLKAVLLPFSIRDNISYVKLCVLQLYSAMFHDDAIQQVRLIKPLHGFMRHNIACRICCVFCWHVVGTKPEARR